MPRHDILDLLLKNHGDLICRVDAHIKQVTDAYPGQIACHKGCDSCCRFLTLFPVEAFALSRAFFTLEEADRNIILAKIRTWEPGEETCPLLADSICLLYSARPVICRTHGFPLYMEKEGKAMVDFCPENFKDTSSLPKDALLNIDQLNTLLAAINAHFVDSFENELPDRIPMSHALFICRELIDEDY